MGIPRICSVPVRPRIEYEAVYHSIKACDAIGSYQRAAGLECKLVIKCSNRCTCIEECAWIRFGWLCKL
jgi:hypothetical protein